MSKCLPLQCIAACVTALVISGIALAEQPPQSWPTNRELCKAGISILMGRDPSIMKIDRTDGAVVYLSYIRPDDRSLWSYRCKIEGNRIIWASSTGRWRTHPLDEVITFSVSGDRLHLDEAYSDQSTTKATFTRAQLK